MKKSILFLSLLLALSFISNAKENASSKRPINITITTQRPSNGPHRAPSQAPVSIVFDCTENTITIQGDALIEANIYLFYHESVVDYSNSLCTTFLLPYNSGEYTILIETEAWTAQGQLII